MNVANWNSAETKPDHSNVYRVRMHIDGARHGSESTIVEGFAYYCARLKRWGLQAFTIRQVDAKSVEHRLRASQAKEWAKV
jgi:hypothetical protein